VSPGSIDSLLKEGVALLSEMCESPRSEALLLLAAAVSGSADCGAAKARLLTHPELEPTPAQAERYHSYLKRRQALEPISYILGEKEFMGLKFVVDCRVLSPRPDTETLVEEAIKVATKEGLSSFLDVCTGSGCVAVSIASFLKGAKAFASDISPGALDVARENARRNNVSVTFCQSDLFEKISGNFDLIVSNPPYIKRGMLDSLPSTIKLHEPRIALDGGIDGLDFHRALAYGAPSRLNPGGWLMLEIGFDQGEKVSALLREQGFVVYIKKDLAGFDRAVCGFMPAPK
jgi:release factor glutamine methyltransferase